VPSSQSSKIEQLWQRPLAREICCVLLAKLIIIIALKVTLFNDPLDDRLTDERLAQQLFSASTIKKTDADL
jgi:hypothetical protein